MTSKNGKQGNDEHYVASFRAIDKEAAHAEAHARPSIELEDDAFLTHFAFQASEESCQTLVAKLGGNPQEPPPRFITGKIGANRIKLERHTELFSCTIIGKNGSALSSEHFLDSLLETDDYFVLTHLTVQIFTNIASMLKAIPFGERTVGGAIRGELELRSTLMPDANGVQQYMVFSDGTGKHELGRRIQRLLEMETYRVLCLLGLETARRTSTELTKLEHQLDHLIIRSEESAELSQDPQVMLNQLAEVSSKLNSLRASVRYRISASKAYHRLMMTRLLSLEEKEAGDSQTLTSFVRSRLDPAIATINSVDQRLHNFSNELSNALSLLRTRIDVELNQANQQTLRNMSKSHAQQLLIAQAVEGLSIVAISYYAVGLVSYVLKAAIAQGWLNISPTIATGVAVPAVVALVGLFLLRLRRHWKAGE